MLASRVFWSIYGAYHLWGQARYPFKPLTVIRRDQARRVRGMVAYAYRHVPYYRETMDRLGLLPSDFKSAEDLTRLPLLERNQLQRDPEYFISTNQALDRCLRLRTGGSSGAPCTVYRDPQAIFKEAAYSNRQRSIITALVGKRSGCRTTVMLSPNSSLYKKHQFCLKRGFFPSRLRPHWQYISLIDPPKKNVSLINEFKPDIVHGYGSYLEILFGYLQDTGEPFHGPKAVTYTSDAMSERAKRSIKQRYNIPVFSTYQAIEAPIMGFECQRQTGLHLNIDLCHLRIVDEEGRTLAKGECGDVVVSNLINRGTVLLNYRLGDVAKELSGRCPCGRSLPLLSHPPGRSDDFIKLSSGRVVHPQAVRGIFSAEEEVWQYQVVQQTANHFNVKIVASERCDRQQTTERIVVKFTHTFGEDVRTKVSFVNAIERTEGGKIRPVISLNQ